MGLSQGAIRDARIQRQLKQSNVTERAILKILLLGPGESGKTTIFKQLVLTKGQGFDTDFLTRSKVALFRNLVQGMVGIITAAEERSLPLPTNKVGQKSKAVILKLLAPQGGQLVPILNSPRFKLTDEIADAVLALWDEPLIQEAYQVSRRFGNYGITDTYEKLIDNLKNYPAWGGKDWLPSPHDCLLLSQHTTGTVSQDFEAEDTTFRLIDVGGQRSERRKWIHLFDGVTAVIYVCNLAEYNQTLFEAYQVNRLQESCSLFKTLAEDSHFKKSAFIVFLNKMDLFEKKYYQDKIPLNVSGLFPDAPVVEDEKDSKCELALKWYEDLLIKQVDQNIRSKFYVHTTTGLDTEQMETVIGICAKHVYEAHLQAHGFLPRV